MSVTFFSNLANRQTKRHTDKRVHTRPISLGGCKYYCVIVSMVSDTLLGASKKKILVSKQETLLILRTYQVHPNNWADILATIQQNLHLLPDESQSMYTTGNYRKLTDRMSRKLFSCLQNDPDIQLVNEMMVF